MDITKIDPTKTYKFVLANANPTPSLEGVHFPYTFTITLEDKVYCPVKQRERIIRYIPGENSIYKDEQTDDGMPKLLQKLTFQKGEVNIEGTETLLMQYLLATNANGANPNRNKAKTPTFVLFNPTEGLNYEMEKDKAISKAKAWCYDAPMSDIIAYARILSIDTRREPAEIRWSLRMVAEKDPVKFSEGLTHKYFNRKKNVYEAIDRGLLTVNRQENSISWTNGGLLKVAAIGKDIIEEFVEMTFEPGNGEMIYSTIEDKLNPGKKEAIKTFTKTSEAEADDIIAKAMERGLIRENGPAWMVIGDKKYQGNIKMVSEKAKSNPEMFAHIKSLVEVEA